MRIWDIDPGYLNRQSLLGEHRELHGIVSIIVNGKKGYAKHPETVRWSGYGWALHMRHRQLAGEMALRGYSDKSPVITCSSKGQWPEVYLDSPERQFGLLREKYTDREEGRIPLPRSVQHLWAQHKYSVLARNPELYRKIGRDVAAKAIECGALSMLLTTVLREPPTVGGIGNAVQHMWGYVSHMPPECRADTAGWPLRRLLAEVQQRAMANGVAYLVESTALGELMVWLPEA